MKSSTSFISASDRRPSFDQRQRPGRRSYHICSVRLPRAAGREPGSRMYRRVVLTLQFVYTREENIYQQRHEARGLMVISGGFSVALLVLAVVLSSDTL